ncbi:MAG: Outer membrane protein OprM [Luteibacter sp.]|uniref:efflux transporter outer membrane subunit n=1 Tax=Luteibacter sp. TaxID=1886636 RepID=UPI001380939F|nr:efflux transporter outer membrane subunit [Luteibacter sp.]KAF1005936.1 MAG: Outer membrane protein OprM [Luteibacter sp.]
MRTYRLTILLAMAFTATACSMAPTYTRPDSPLPLVYAQHPGGGGDNAATLGWHEVMPDPRLRALVDLALKNNRDLKLAVLNAEAVHSQFRVERSARLPSLGANSQLQRTGGAGQSSLQGMPGRMDQRTATLDLAAYEVDLFGRVKSLSDAAWERYLSSEEGTRSARIALVAGVAQAYVEQRVATEQLDLARRTLTDWQESLRITRALHGADQVGGIDLAQAQGQVDQAEADISAREREVAQADNALALLVGAALPTDLPAPLALDASPVLTTLPAGLPSDLLVHRPDVAQAEHDLKAANADIGAARAAFFPRITLTGSYGFGSGQLSDLFKGASKTWSFTPQISQPIFQGGKLRAELRLAEIRKSSAVVGYEKALQVAFREVSDGLAGQATYGGQLDAQRRVVDSATRRAKLSGLRYEAGQDSRLELLDAQRQRYAAEQSLLDLRRAALTNTVNLYKALGGGEA